MQCTKSTAPCRTRTKVGPRSAAQRDRGVLLINLGTPESPAVPAVRTYLAQFLSDPEVIQLPNWLSWMNRPLARLIAQFRAPKSAAMYAGIWTRQGSPLKTLTEAQASKLASVLPEGWRVFYAMRYGRPSIADTLKQVEAAGIEELVVVPMYPQFSGPTTGTALRELYGSLRHGHDQINVITRNTWFDDGGYIYAQAKLLETYARRHNLAPENTHLLFSAHGLPVSYVKRGDPYLTHVRKTVELVSDRLGWPAQQRSLAYQSRFGPSEWVKPATDERLMELADAGETRVLICPISFTVDCLETLEELDIRYRRPFESAGGVLHICPALNDFDPFITALKNVVLEGPRPISSWSKKVRPLLATRDHPPVVDPDINSLVAVCLSVANRVDGCAGPLLQYVSEAELQQVKKPQYEVPDLLRSICENGDVREALLWNTCNRFEFYGWGRRGDNVSRRQCIVAQARDHLFDRAANGRLAVNILYGVDAWHHMMRTVAGLNSMLPGDRDVIDQLLTALRLAERAGTAGPLAARLVREVIDKERRLRGDTKWGRFDPGYCFAALSRLVAAEALKLDDARIVVIGGSTTSRSVLSTLTERFDVPASQLTLIYRGHSGGHLKMLRKAIGGGRRIRVQHYGEDASVRAILDADIVVFGIDRDKPVLTAEQIVGARDFKTRPLMILDMNTFGSTSGFDAVEGITLWDAKRLDRAVEAYADAMTQTPQFLDAVAEADRWILDRLPSVRGEPIAPHECHGLIEAASARTGRVRPCGTQDRWRTCVACGMNYLPAGDRMAGSARL